MLEVIQIKWRALPPSRLGKWRSEWAIQREREIRQRSSHIEIHDYTRTCAPQIEFQIQVIDRAVICPSFKILLFSLFIFFGQQNKKAALFLYWSTEISDESLPSRRSPGNQKSTLMNCCPRFTPVSAILCLSSQRSEIFNLLQDIPTG